MSSQTKQTLVIPARTPIILIPDHNHPAWPVYRVREGNKEQTSYLIKALVVHKRISYDTKGPRDYSRNRARIYVYLDDVHLWGWVSNRDFNK